MKQEENEHLIYAVHKMTQWSRSRAFYNTLKTPLTLEDEISKTALEVIYNSDPTVDCSEAAIENRNVALKIIERIIEIEPKFIPVLHKIIVNDEILNKIIGIKIVQGFFSKKIISIEEFFEFVDSMFVCTINYFNEILGNNLTNLHAFNYLLYFIFESIKNSGMFNQSAKNLINYLEKSIIFFLENKQTEIKNQINYTLFKYLGFLIEMQNPNYDNLIGKIILFLLANISDESKELIISLYNKIGSMADKLNNINFEFQHFTKSIYLDVKACGIKNYLKLLRNKQGIKGVLENIQMIIFGSILNLLEYFDENSIKNTGFYLDSLFVTNKLFCRDQIIKELPVKNENIFDIKNEQNVANEKNLINIFEKKNFRKNSLVMLLKILEKLKIKLEKNVTEKIYDASFYLMTIILKNLEDQIAFSYREDSFSNNITPINPKEIFTDEFYHFEKLFLILFQLIEHKPLRNVVEKIFNLFLFISYASFNNLIIKYSELILKETRKKEYLNVIWNIFLSHTRTSLIFAGEIYKLIIKDSSTKEMIFWNSRPEIKKNLLKRDFSDKNSDKINTFNLLSKEERRYFQSHCEIFEKIDFFKKCLKKILNKEKHTPSNLEKIFLSVNFLTDLRINFWILNVIFDQMKHCHDDTTFLPKVIHDSLPLIFNLMKKLQIKSPENSIYISTIYKIPVSIVLLSPYYNDLIYFIAEGIKFEREIKEVAYKIFEQSLKIINTEAIMSSNAHNLITITKVLLKDSRGGTFAMAATKILSMYHSEMKVYINNCYSLIDNVYPQGLIYTPLFDRKSKQKIEIFKTDFIIFECITKIKGDFIHEDTPHNYSLTTIIHSFRKHHLNSDPDIYSKNIIICFLYSVLGWDKFESDEIYNRTAAHLKYILKGQLEKYDKIQTQGFSHISRVSMVNFSSISKHQHYVYDSILSMFLLKEEDFLYCVYSVVIVYIAIYEFRLFVRQSKIYLNYDVLLHALTESYSLYEINDLPVKSIYEDLIYDNKEYNYNENVEEILEEYLNDLLPHKILNRIILVCKETELELQTLIMAGIFDQLMEEFLISAFFVNSKKQVSAILGISSLILLLKNHKDWIFKYFKEISASFLFYIGQKDPYYKNLVFYSYKYLLILTKDFDIQFADSEYLDSTKKLQKYMNPKTSAKTDIVQQLFYDLSSKDKYLRNLSLQLLKFASKVRNITMKDLLFKYIKKYYENVNYEFVNASSITETGHLDCFLLLNQIHPIEVTSFFFSVFQKVFSEENFSYDEVLLKILCQKFVLNRNSSEDLINRTIDFFIQNIKLPYFEDPKIIGVSREVLKFTIKPQTSRNIKKAFQQYFLDKSTLIANKELINKIINIFPPELLDEFTPSVYSLLVDYYDEASRIAFKLISLNTRILETYYEKILSYFSSMSYELCIEAYTFLAKHLYYVDFMCLKLNESFVYDILVRIVKENKRLSLNKNEIQSLNGSKSLSTNKSPCLNNNSEPANNNIKNLEPEINESQPLNNNSQVLNNNLQSVNIGSIDIEQERRIFNPEKKKLIDQSNVKYENNYSPIFSTYPANSLNIKNKVEEIYIEDKLIRTLEYSNKIIEYLKIKRFNLSDNCQSEKLLNTYLLLSNLNYKFDSNELNILFKRFNPNLFSYYLEFINLNNLFLTLEDAKSRNLNLPTVFIMKNYQSINYNLNEENCIFLFENRIYDEKYLSLIKNKKENSFNELSYLALYAPNSTVYKKILLFEESPSRILENLKNIPFDKSICNSILEIFEKNIDYKIHLMVLMPLLIENPSLINEKILPKVIDTIYRLLGTSSAPHKITAGHLLYTCVQATNDYSQLYAIYNQFLNFCISSQEKEFLILLKKINLPIKEEIILEDFIPKKLSECLDHLINSGLNDLNSSSIKSMFLALIPSLTDDLFYDSFAKLFPILTKDNPLFLINLLKSVLINPKIGFYAIIESFNTSSIPQQDVILAIEELIRTNFIFDVNLLIEKYSYERNSDFLRILGKLICNFDNPIIYSEAIKILNNFEEKFLKILRNTFFKTKNLNENFFNFLIFIFRNQNFELLYQELQPYFAKGLECKYKILRDEFFLLLRETLPNDKLERLKYLLSLDWNSFDNIAFCFFRLFILESFNFNTLKQYQFGDDYFYETIYIRIPNNKKEEIIEKQKTEVSVDSYEKFFVISDFKNTSLKFSTINIEENIFEKLFCNKNLAVDFLSNYLKCFNFSVEEDFRGFALNLNVSNYNSYLIDNLLFSFNSFVMDVRIKHNCYFSNLDKCSESQKHLIYFKTGDLINYISCYNPLFTSTEVAINEFLLNNFENARFYLQKTLEAINEENFSELESNFATNLWKYSMKQLCQWDTLLEVSVQLQDIDLESEIYFLSREANNNFLEILRRKNDSFEKYIYEAICSPLEQDFDSLMFLCLTELNNYPIYSPKFIEIMNKAQLITEIFELQNSKKDSLNQLRIIWSKRLPYTSENIINWIYFFSWRSRLFSLLVKEESSFLSDLAPILNKVTYLSLKSNNLEMAEYYNSLVFSIPGIKASDSFQKVIDEFEILAKKNDLEGCLRKIKTTNVSYFSNEQKAIIFNYLAKIEQLDSSFKTANQIYSQNSQMFLSWGDFLERNNHSVIDIFSCYTQSAMYAKINVHKPFLKMMKYFKCEDSNILKILEESILNINLKDCLIYFNCILKMYIQTDNSCAELCISNFSEIAPQQVLRNLKVEIDTFKQSNSTYNVNVEKLYHIISKLKFDKPNIRLGLALMLSLINCKFHEVPEQLAHALLNYVYSNVLNQANTSDAEYKAGFDMSRLFNCVWAAKWNEELREEFLVDFNFTDTTILSLKTFKWLEIVENIINTYVTSKDLDLSTSRLVEHLDDYEILVFGKEDCYIDHFIPSSTFYITKNFLGRTLSLITTTGREYLYISQHIATISTEPEDFTLEILNLLSYDIKEEVNYEYSLNIKNPVRLGTDLRLFLIENPIICIGNLYDYHLEKNKKNTRQLTIEFLEVLQDLAGSKIRGLQEILEGFKSSFVMLKKENGKIGKVSSKFEVQNSCNLQSSKVNLQSPKVNLQSPKVNLQSPTDLESVMSASKDNLQSNDNLQEIEIEKTFSFAQIPRIHKVNSLKKIIYNIKNDILTKEITLLYGHSTKYFLFKRRFIAEYAMYSTICYLFDLIPVIPSQTCFSLNSGEIKALTINHSLNIKRKIFRISPNIVNLFGKEGLEGTFIFNLNNFRTFLENNDFLEEYVNCNGFFNYDSVKDKLNELKNPKKIINESMDPEVLVDICMSWLPWL